MNPVLTLTHNGLDLTKRCIESIRSQDIPTEIMVIDNNSTDGTWEWCLANGLSLGFAYPQNRGVSVGWNDGLEILFTKGYEHVLVVGNDTVLPKSFYSTLLNCQLPFVTGVAVDNYKQANEKPSVLPFEARPDFSAFLIRWECWNKVGPFDERMKLYASDTDYHVRAHRAGMDLWKAAVPFYHERSSTLRLASPDEQVELYEQAHQDRRFFQEKYGCLPGTTEYESLFA